MSTKIPLFKAKSLGFDRDMVTFSAKYGNIPIFITKAIVDTGCPFTIISESSLKRTRIPYQNKNTKYRVLVGNIELDLKELGKCRLSFKDENNKLVILEQEIYVGVPITKGYIAQEIPSFIGKDLLSSHLLSIINTRDGSHLLKEDE